MPNTIQMSRLGTMGQWGNEFFQYNFLRTYARRYGLDYQVPPWVGQYIFGHDDPPVDKPLPPKEEKFGPCAHEACFGVPIAPVGDEFAAHDFVSYAQWHTSYYNEEEREFIQGLWSKPIGEMAERVLPAAEHLQSLGRTVIGLHIRRADAGRMIYHISPVSWYLKWLKEHWHAYAYANPVLFLATEDLSLVPAFARYNPVLVENLGITLRAEPYPLDDTPTKAEDLNPPKPRRLDYFPDWWMLANCDVIVASDSTFSFTAAMANQRLREFWQSQLTAGGFVWRDPWNSEVSQREHLSDHPGIPGTQVDENPYYQSGYKPKHKAVPE